MTDAPMAKVLVNASGRNSLPSWSVRKKTGMNETSVFETAVTIAPPTSRGAVEDFLEMTLLLIAAWRCDGRCSPS